MILGTEILKRDFFIHRKNYNTCLKTKKYNAVKTKFMLKQYN